MSARFARAARLEGAAAACACALAAVLASWRLLRPGVVSGDALVHQYWLWRFRDPALFTDPLTAQLRESSRYPDGYEALFRVASQVLDPIAFGEWLGVGLMAVSGLLVFAIVREHASWKPSAWIAAGAFLALVEAHRFHGGFPRGFVHPVVLLTVLLALRGRGLAAALVPPAGALLYPPAALLAAGALAVSALRRAEPPARGPRLGPLPIDLRRAGFAALALALAAVAVLVPAWLAGGSPRVFTAAEARAYPEFGPQGTLRFFNDSLIGYLRQNRSGFDLRDSGSILALAALALLAARPGGLRELRAEVLALPVVALGAYAVAQAVLFRLYLPHRYTYPLLAFFAIAVGVLLLPAWIAAWAARRRRLLAFGLLCAPAAVGVLALYAFPLAPDRPRPDLLSWEAGAAAAAMAGLAGAVAAALGRLPQPRAPQVGAVLTGGLLLGVMVAGSDAGPRGTPCPQTPASRYLAGLPKDAVVAGDPIDSMCLPATARRAVVISTQLAPAYEVDYFREGRSRMFRMLQAYYGGSVTDIAALGPRYGATHLWVRRRAVERELGARGVRWRARRLPYGRFVRGLVARGSPAALRLPVACRLWRRGQDEVYDVACLGRP